MADRWLRTWSNCLMVALQDKFIDHCVHNVNMPSISIVQVCQSSVRPVPDLDHRTSYTSLRSSNPQVIRAIINTIKSQASLAGLRSCIRRSWLMNKGPSQVSSAYHTNLPSCSTGWGYMPLLCIGYLPLSTQPVMMHRRA